MTSPEPQVSEYIMVRLVEVKPKTVVYDILSAHHGAKLGQVRWYGPWRQYVFEPESLTVFNRGCLEVICGFLQKLMDARKKEVS